jgi:hypothetical protein
MELIENASLRRKTFARPLPDGAELFTRVAEMLAKWKDGNKTKTSPVAVDENGSPRLGTTDGKPQFVLTFHKWLGKHRDGDGLLVEVSTGCHRQDRHRTITCRPRTPGGQRTRRGCDHRRIWQ